MVDKISSGFLGCINPCNLRWQNFSINQVKPAGFGLFEGTFPNDMGECEECKMRFSFFKRKKFCNGCGLSYCSSCVKRLTGGKHQCKKCDILSHWPIIRAEISSLRVRDLRYFLSTCNIPTNTCREKQDLIDLTIVQLHHRHFGLSRHHNRQGFAGEENNSSNSTNPTGTATASSTATSSASDDGIRVRPLNTNSGTTRSANAHAEDPYTLEIIDDEPGIRVFASSLDVIGPNTSRVEASEAHSNLERTTSSSSSSWSLLQAEGEQDGALSSDSLSQNSNLDNPSNNLPPDNDSEIIQQIIDSDDVPVTADLPEQLQPSESRHISALNVVKLSSLETEDSIKELSVRQCKEILTLHRVDFSGVWEKHELINKIKMLWKDYRRRVEDVKNLPEDQVCKICMDAAIDCVLLECGHIVSCTDCGKQMAECPLCRQNVIRVVKTFRA